MAVSVVPALIDALVTQSRTALGSTAAVYDGYGASADPGNYLMVGVDDPDQAQPAPSMSESQAMATLGTPRSRDEEGSIPNVAYCWNGDGENGQKAARDAAYAIVEAVAALLRTDPTMGVGQPGRVVCQVGDISLDQNSAQGVGAYALITFTVAFKARI